MQRSSRFINSKISQDYDIVCIRKLSLDSCMQLFRIKQSNAQQWGSGHCTPNGNEQCEHYLPVSMSMRISAKVFHCL